jgi:hypothetical protein
MRQIDLNYLVITALLLSGLYVAITGLVVDLFGLHQFYWHRFAGYASAVLAGLHLVLKWGRVTAYLRWRFRRPGRELPKQQPRGPLLGRRGFLVSALAAVAGFLVGWLTPDRQQPVAVPNETTDIGQFYHRWSKPG